MGLIEETQSDSVVNVWGGKKLIHIKIFPQMYVVDAFALFYFTQVKPGYTH